MKEKIKNPKVEVCSYCSGFDVNELKGKVKAKTNCIGKCSKKNPELNGKVYGFLNGEFTVCDTKEEFFNIIEGLDSYEPTSKKNALVDAFLEENQLWSEEHKKLRECCLECDMTEEFKWGQPCYSYHNKNVVIIGGFKAYVVLSFFKGALLSDKAGLLMQQTVNIQAGRQLRFTSVDEIEEKKMLIKMYIEEAIQIEEAGLQVVPEKKPEMQIPEELQSIFNENPAFYDAFYALTPGRQRGYLFHFNGAKQSKTRTARIEKYMPKIFEGYGIDD